MLIEIWSDVVCPWCYIGKRRLERALADFPHEVEIVWRSFMLDPGAPTEPSETVPAALGRKYGGGEAAGRDMVARVETVARAEGLSFDHGSALHLNTLDAHRLLHLAVHEGGPALQGRLKEALLAAYFTRAENVADHEVLARVATSAGLHEVRVREVLTSDEYADEVAADIEQAQDYGAGGVPFFVIDRKFGVSGAQATEVFGQVLERAWAEAHPALDVVAAGDACGPDGCAI